MGDLDKLLGGLLGGKGGGGGLADALGGLTGGTSGIGGGGGSGGGMVAALLPMLGGLLAGGGLNKILSGFQAQGLSAQADSWVGKGPNEPVSGAQVRQAIGDDEIDQVAAKLGVSRDEAAEAVAAALPQVVDTVSPDGQLPPEQDLNQAFDRLAHSSATT